MTKYIYTQCEPLKAFAALTTGLKASNKKFAESHEIRLSVRRNQNVLLLQTHIALEPSSVCGRLDIRNCLESDLDITVAAEPLRMCISALGSVAFLKLTFDESQLRLEAATFGGGLFPDDDYSVIESKNAHYVNIQQTHLIADYRNQVLVKTTIFGFRAAQLHVLKALVDLANCAKKRKNVQAVFSNDGSVISIELNATDLCTRLRLLEHNHKCDVDMRLDLEQLEFFKIAVATLINAKLGRLEVSFTEQSQIVLSCAQIQCAITQRQDFESMTSPSAKKTRQGWCYEANGKLMRGLKDIVVTKRHAEDIVEIKVMDGQIHCLQATDYASGLFCTEIEAATKPLYDGPTVIVNRKQLYLALQCFNTYEKMQIHGLLMRENQLTLKPSSNTEEFVVLSTTDNLDSQDDREVSNPNRVQNDVC